MAKRDKNFHDYIVYDLLAELDGITSRPMFSGWGIYKNGQIFAIISESGLYLKGNKEKAKVYEEGGGKRFEYTVKNRKAPVKLPYWSVPEEILENREKLLNWVEIATNRGL